MYLLAHGVAFYARSSSFGRWRAQVDAGKPAVVLHGGGTRTLAIFAMQESEVRLDVDCWRLSSSSVSAELVWRRPASRCFPTCSDVTHQLTGAEYRGSRLAQRVGQYKWTWAGIAGLEFTFPQAEQVGVLVTPWGHGEWGITPSRDDVLVAEFAQQRHMLRFEHATASFVSTRCSDGEVVRGTAVGWSAGMKW